LDLAVSFNFLGAHWVASAVSARIPRIIGEVWPFSVLLPRVSSRLFDDDQAEEVFHPYTEDETLKVIYLFFISIKV